MKEEIEYQVKVAKVDSTIIQEAMQRELENSGVEVKDNDFKELFKAPEAEANDAEAKKNNNIKTWLYDITRSFLWSQNH